MNKSKWLFYIKATRPHLAIFFIEVIIGAIIASKFDIFSIDLIKLLIVFISFQSLYYGIYIINDLLDYEYDKKSPRKEHRPIASGKISKKGAFIFSSLLILIAFLISSSFSRILVYFEIFFLSYVLIYTLLLKRIPYLDTISGSVTHTARIIMGISLYGVFNYYLLAIFLIFTFSSFLLIKRIKEIKYTENVKRPIEYYSEEGIKIVWLSGIPLGLILVFISKQIESVIILCLLVIYTITIGLYFKSSKIRKLFEKIAD